jgi:hypothetical protein
MKRLVGAFSPKRRSLMKFVCALALLAFTFTPAAPASADDGFRCPGGKLVSRGDHMVEVRQKCGDPDQVSQRVDKRKVKVKVKRWIDGVQEEVSEEQVVDVVIDEWVYDLGPQKFIRYVDFENSRLVQVTTGSYGAQARN